MQGHVQDPAWASVYARLQDVVQDPVCMCVCKYVCVCMHVYGGACGVESSVSGATMHMSPHMHMLPIFHILSYPIPVYYRHVEEHGCQDMWLEAGECLWGEQGCELMQLAARPCLILYQACTTRNMMCGA